MAWIAADNHFGVMAVLFVIAAAGFLGEKTRLGAQLTGAVIAILGAILAANVGIIPHRAPAYDFVLAYVVPVLVPLFLFRADLRRLLFETTRTTGAFLLASMATLVGVTVAVLLLDLSQLAVQAPLAPGQREPAIAGLFASTYIGGSVNYAALGEITGLNRDPSFFAAATAADNLMGALYLGLLATLPGWRWLANRFADHDHQREYTAEIETGEITPLSLVVSLALATVIVAVGDAITAQLGSGNWRYIVISLLALGAATFLPGLQRFVAGSMELGIALSLVFFAALAAGADVGAMISVAPLLMLMVLVLLAVHALVTFGIGRWLGLSLPELVTASNAAVLGATTAPALAAAKGWRNLVTPGVLVGVFGYALGTVVGSLVFSYWGAIL